MIRYKLDNLGWFQFETLVQSALKAELGLAVECWGGRGDLGRDAYCEQALEFPTKGNLSEGPFVFQMKFVEEANAAGAKPAPRVVAAVRAEMSLFGSLTPGEHSNRFGKKATTRSKNIAQYVLITNAPLTALMRKGIVDLVKETLRSTQVTVLDGKDVCALLDSHPKLRQAFPQLLGLSDLNKLLSETFNKDAFERSTLAIEQAQEISKVFYPTTAFNHSLKVLHENHFVVLEGMPEVGKTAIARIIALTQLSLGWEAYECTNPTDVLRLYKKEKQQVFVADDAFGSTEYDPQASQLWAKEMDGLL